MSLYPYMKVQSILSRFQCFRKGNFVDSRFEMGYDSVGILQRKAAPELNYSGTRVQFTHNVSTEALRRLWEICFPEDATGFAKLFLERYYVPSQAVCIVNDDGSTVESALYWLPCTYQIGGKQGTFLYIYAMGTHPEYRKRGNLRNMLEFTEKYCREQGFDGILLHAMPSSKSSVERFGMKPLLMLNVETHLAIGTQEDDWVQGRYEDFRELRSRYLKGLSGCVYWEERELCFVYEDLCRDGKLVFFQEEDQLHYGILSKGNNEICIEETDCANGLIHRLTGPVRILKPGSGSYGAHVKIYRKSLQEQDLGKLYFNLMLK